MRVILHADDLGISTEVNEAIFSLMQERKLTSASILANGPEFEEAIRGAKAFSNCSFGVHLNITEFEPLSRRLGERALLGMPPGRRLIRRPKAQICESVLEEWTRQVERVRDAGIDISHIDSHHHTHTRFSLFGCLKILCRTQKIRRVRTRQTFTCGSINARWRFDHRLYNQRLRRHFCCTDEFGAFAAVRFEVVASDATVEVMLHPGNARYAIETGAFRKRVDAGFLRHFQCISYHDLS